MGGEEAHCRPGDATGPAHEQIGSDGQCFAWSYQETVNGAAPTHSYAYVDGSLLLDYGGDNGQYKIWRLAHPPRSGCPAVQWPAAASGTLAITQHAFAPVPSVSGFGLLDYDPLHGDFRFAVQPICNARFVPARLPHGLKWHFARRQCTDALGGWIDHHA